jgi:pimeloyl-ACP methyl ester carboxylesterase
VRKTLIVTAFAALAALTSSCAMLGLRPQLEEVEKLQLFTGTVTRASRPDSPVIVVLLDRRGGAQPIAAYDLLPRDGDYYLVAMPGDYDIVAFEDANRDFVYQRDERVGRLSGPPLDAAADRSERTRGRIAVESGGAGLGVALDLSASGLADSAPRRAGRLGALVSLGDPRFSPENAERGVYKPFDFLRDVGPALYFLEPYDPARTPVLFVHGMGGTPRDFETIVAHLDRTRFQPWVYHYPSGLPLGLSSWYLEQALEELRARHGFSRMTLIAHSMGGLVSRGALVWRVEQQRPLVVDHFITISTPWRGHAGARLGVKSAPVVVPSWHDMNPGSVFQQRLFANRLSPPVTIDLLFGHRGGSLFTPGTDDGTVAVSSMLAYEAQDEARRVYGLDEDHMSVLRSEKTLALLDRLLSAAPAP